RPHSRPKNYKPTESTKPSAVPNNSGKSSLLRETQQLASSVGPIEWRGVHARVVAGYDLRYDGTVDDLIEYMTRTFWRREPGQYPDGFQNEVTFRLFNGSIVKESDVKTRWHSQASLGSIANVFCQYLNAEQRLPVANATQSFDPMSEYPSSPLQILSANKSIERELDDLVRGAFGSGIVLNRFAGPQLRLHVGRMTSRVTGSPPSVEYLEEMARLPTMDLQGDGIRAFVGIVLAVLTSPYSVIMIDEPEAFLHPPQARLLGSFIESHARRTKTRIVIATHSEDILGGIIDSRRTTGEITFARVTRNETGNHISQIASALAKDLFNDPLMQFFDMLNGLFAPGVILCEADGDCTYYRAVSSRIDNLSLRTSHFTHTAGKDRMLRAVRTLRTVSVPVACIYDIDIFQDERKFQVLVEEAGLDWAVLQPLRNQIVHNIDGLAVYPRRAELQSELNAVLDSFTQSHLNGSTLRELSAALKVESGWSRFKFLGIAALDAGGRRAYAAATEMLEANGIFIVAEGELERFHPDVVQSDKAEWLRTVLAQKLYRNSTAQDLLRRVAFFIERQQ
ncbi:AAA family ATPase, partial [Subtercola sp. YIM 133946]|uniref:AAA family ATPase n=1 Tax=Subtercola sp. YIM 133946 TaxID=3118909 RepID=UPI002F95ED0B